MLNILKELSVNYWFTLRSCTSLRTETIKDKIYNSRNLYYIRDASGKYKLLIDTGDGISI